MLALVDSSCLLRGGGMKLPLCCAVHSPCTKEGARGGMDKMCLPNLLLLVVPCMCNGYRHDIMIRGCIEYSTVLL